MALILRRDKGNALTYNEMDDNLDYLETRGGGTINILESSCLWKLGCAINRNKQRFVKAHRRP